MAEVKIGQKVLCANCTEDIFTVFNVLIKCVECDTANPLFLCPDCFALNCDLGDHKPEHQYRIVDNAGFKVVKGDWSAREHLNLLDSVERYGIGNWEDISRQINKLDDYGINRTPEDTKNEFNKNFIVGKIGNHTWKEDQRGRARDHTQGNPLLPPSQPPDAPSNLTLNEAIVLGYMPKRDDFEVEYDNEAGKLVSPLPSGPNPDEEDIDIALKMAQVDMYKLKLRERERRKRVAADHQLITQFFKENTLSANQRTVIPRRKKDKNDLIERLKIHAEFQGVEEHLAFIGSIVRERDLKSKIKDLQRARKNGITTLTDSQEYETGRLKRIKRKKGLGLSRRLAAANAANAPPEGANVGSPASIKSEDTASMAWSPATANSPKPEEKQFSIVGLPGFEVLSCNERKLCKKKGRTPKPLNPTGLDKGNRKIIFQFLMRAGWITAY